MSDAQSHENPIARVLLGWTFRRGAGAIFMAALALIGASLLVSEIVRPRSGARMPFEDMAGFYLLAGAGAAIAGAAGAAVIRLALARRAPYPPDAADEEAGA